MSATNVARAGKRGNICVGNNVSLFARALRTRDLALYEVAVIELNLRLPRANEVSDIVEGSYLILLNYRNGGLCTWP